MNILELSKSLGATIKGRESIKGNLPIECPLVCGKTFEINTKKNVWNCFRKCICCPVNDKYTMTTLYMLFSGCNTEEEANEEIKKLDQNSPHHFQYRSAQNFDTEDKTANIDARNKIYQAFLNELTLKENHLLKLKQRGLGLNDITKFGYKSYPSWFESEKIIKDMENKGYSFKNIPGFYTSKSGETKIVKNQGFFIPYKTADGKISNLQVRRDIDLSLFTDPVQFAKEKKQRYRWFSSSGYENGGSAKSVPFYGTKIETDVVYITEGGLKAAIAQTLGKRWFVSIPGVNSVNAFKTLLDYLESENIKTIVNAFDMDRYTNPNVEACVNKLMLIAKQKGFDVKTWDWDPTYKGCDDFLNRKNLFWNNPDKLYAKNSKI